MFKLAKDDKFTQALDKTIADLEKLSNTHLVKLATLKRVDNRKPHLYFTEGKWHYRSAWMGFDYINGPSEERNNQAMLWCWNQNYNKPIDNEIIFS